jgi:hypothetical protein
MQNPGLDIPDEFVSTDLDLINPVNWSLLNQVK